MLKRWWLRTNHEARRIQHEISPHCFGFDKKIQGQTQYRNGWPFESMNQRWISQYFVGFSLVIFRVMTGSQAHTIDDWFIREIINNNLLNISNSTIATHMNVLNTTDRRCQWLMGALGEKQMHYHFYLYSLFFSFLFLFSCLLFCFVFVSFISCYFCCLILKLKNLTSMISSTCETKRYQRK